MANAQMPDYDQVMDEFDFDNDEEDVEDFRGLQEDHFASDFDEEFDVPSGSSAETDTTAAQARQGKDIQGILWDRLQITRDKYRESRLLQYKNYENLNVSHEDLEKECLEVSKDGKFYSFWHNTRAVKSTVVHFQLRNLVWATSKHDIYVMHNSSVLHWSPFTCGLTEVLNATRPIVPSLEVGKLSQFITGTKKFMGFAVKCKASADKYYVCKKQHSCCWRFQGELVCKSLDRPGVSYCNKITYDENAITNAIEIYENNSGATQLMTSNNDSFVRVFDTEKFEVLQKFNFPWPVNHTSISPDKRLVVVVGDSADAYIMDSQTGKVLTTLRGHLDYCFASAWHPDGHIFATGNQDTSCRLWDVRNMSSSFAVLKGRIGAIRSLRFSSDGRYLAMAEPADFVHIFDVYEDFKNSQEIDIFGEIAGISYSPDTDALFIGVADRTYGSLLEYHRNHVNTYRDYLC